MQFKVVCVGFQRKLIHFTVDESFNYFPSGRDVYKVSACNYFQLCCLFIVLHNPQLIGTFVLRVISEEFDYHGISNSN